MRWLLIISALVWFQSVSAQLSVQNVLEAQYGKLPNETAEPFPSLYDRLIAKYKKKAWSASATVEQYHTKFDSRNYVSLSQAQLRYKRKKWDVELGNFYETIGRGLLVRSYEIRGSILEDIGFRSRNYFHRDLLGANVSYKSKSWSFGLMHGYSLNNVLPPTFERSQRRSDQITAASVNYRLSGHRLGISVINLKQPTTEHKQFFTTFAKGPFLGGLDYAVEIASSVDQPNTYAIYSSISGSAGNLSYALEYKRYRNFVLGSGINEPPALIKQHTYKLLNRSTHVTNPDNEQGYQMDVFYLLDNGSSIVFNHALAYNDFANKQHLFQEYFVEWSSNVGEESGYKLFVDYAQDPFKNESNRIATGLYVELSLGDNLLLKPEVEFQTFRRNQRVNNQSYSLGLKHESLFFALQLENTTDPFLVKAGETSHYYLGGVMDYRINRKHGLKLFVGERRGGPLCSAGICYEILDFKGIEVRWTSRW